MEFQKLDQSIGLDILFSVFADEDTMFGLLLRFIRYASLGYVVAFGVPWIFVKTGLADQTE